MDTTKLIIPCLIILFIIGLNVGLIMAVRRGTFLRDIDLFRRAAQSARDPWKRETEDLEELSRLVGQLKDHQRRDEKPD